MSVISGTRRGMKELVDGTIRVQIDIDPIHRAEFFAAFSRIDMPVAMAPLVANFERIKPADQNTKTDMEYKLRPNVDKAVSPLKGGELAKWAGILSNDPLFWEWAGVENADQAAEWIRDVCHVGSRAELDHNPGAAKTFRRMMGNFDAWNNRGVAA